MNSLESLLIKFPDHIAEQQQLEERLQDLVREGDWEEALSVLGLMPDTPCYSIAADCIMRSIRSAGVGIVSQLLSALPAGEYAGSEDYHVSWPALKHRGTLNWELSLHGTLIMHAVAEGRSQLLSLLLSRGHDPNSASPAAAEALLHSACNLSSCYGEDFSPIDHHTARAESCIKLQQYYADPNTIAPLEIEGATPLALAVMLGNAGAVRQLIKHGAWTEAPSVSQCMYLFWMEDDANYRAAREEVLKTGCRPVLKSACICCSPKQLELLLKNHEYNRSERAAAARAMLIAYRFQQQLWADEEKRWQDLCSRLLLLGDAIETSGVLGELLLTCCDSKICTIEPFLPVLKGKTLDLSRVGSMQFGLNRRDNAKKFRLLVENCRLIMDRDAVYSSLPTKNLKAIIKYVSFLPPTVSTGVSGLSIAILRTGDLRLIRQAFQTGLIPPEESTEELLQCQKELELSPACRSLLLTRPALPPNPPTVCTAPFQMHNHWFPLKTEGRCMPLVTEGDEKWFYPSLRHSFGLAVMESAGLNWHIDSVLHGLCAAGRADFVRRWLGLCPGELTAIVPIHSPEKELRLILTPLCTAAFFGQNETVSLLLEIGAGAAEETWGYPSLLCTEEGGMDKALPVTPLLCAMLAGHTDTAELLMEHGASPDGFEELYKTLLVKFTQ